jgi:hypothetical protein
MNNGTECFEFIDTKVICNSDLDITVPICFRGNCTLSGRGYSVLFQEQGSMIIKAGSQLTLEDLEMDNLAAFKVHCVTQDGSLVLKNSILNLASDYTFSTGSILFSEDVVFTGTNIFNYTTKQGSTIDKNSQLFFAPGSTFKYVPDRANRELLFLTDQTSSLRFDGSTLHSTHTGLQLTRGTLIIDDSVTFTSEARIAVEALSLKSDLCVVIRGGANLNLQGLILAE